LSEQKRSKRWTKQDNNNSKETSGGSIGPIGGAKTHNNDWKTMRMMFRFSIYDDWLKALEFIDSDDELGI
jgi:hypothetical protein